MGIMHELTSVEKMDEQVSTVIKTHIHPFLRPGCEDREYSFAKVFIIIFLLFFYFI